MLPVTALAVPAALIFDRASLLTNDGHSESDILCRTDRPFLYAA